MMCGTGIRERCKQGQPSCHILNGEIGIVQYSNSIPLEVLEKDKNILLHPPSSFEMILENEPSFYPSIPIF